MKQFGVKKRGGVEVGETGNFFFFSAFSLFPRTRDTGRLESSNGVEPWTISSFLRTLDEYNKKKFWSKEKQREKKKRYSSFFLFFPFGRLFYFILTKHANDQE